jgi:hypothetical protein
MQCPNFLSLMKHFYCQLFGLILMFCQTDSLAGSTQIEAVQLNPVQRRIVEAANEMLETMEISYVYGGSEIGGEVSCDRCNACLEQKQPKPKLRLAICPSCKTCSLDCSHFTHLVLNRAGAKHPYLTSVDMADMSSEKLLDVFGFIDLGRDITKASVGDLLVYRGHVVILEKINGPGLGDVVHATGGKDLKGPGQGLQRERNAHLLSFRGALLRILRHKNAEFAGKPIKRLRPAK